MGLKGAKKKKSYRKKMQIEKKRLESERDG